MSFKQWVNGLLGGSNNDNSMLVVAVPTVTDPMEDEADGINFRTAIAAHQKWKTRFQAVIDGNHSEDLAVEAISRDDQCDLGKWIHGVGGKLFGSDELFQVLHKNHVHFHLCAGTVLELTQNGKTADAQASLKSGEYARVSQAIILDLVKMYNRASSKHKLN